MSSQIAILMTTYNSELYVKEQLDSLFAQSFQAFTLYIHDDGSQDSTMEILNQYRSLHDNVVLLDDSQKGRKAMGSFCWLLQQVDAPYYMFCDHDDVWLPEKIEKTYALMLETEKHRPNQPVVVNTDLCVVDAQLKVLYPSFWRYNKIDRNLLGENFNYLAVCNAFTGCTMMINQKAKQVSLPFSEKAIMHDQWIGLSVAAAGGALPYLDQATLLYRQHGDNEVGAQQANARYYGTKLLFLLSTIKGNLKTLGMVRCLKRFSWPKYIRYKVAYYIKRFR